MDATPPPLTVLVAGAPDAVGAIVAALESPRLRVETVTPEQLGTSLRAGASDVVVLTDEPAAVAAVADAARTTPATRYLAVTSGMDPAVALDAGIGGVVAGSDPAALQGAVVGIALGEGFMDARLAQEVLDRHRQRGLELTATEEEVVSRLSSGDDAETIADEYAVTPRLVRLHAGGALSRLLPT